MGPTSPTRLALAHDYLLVMRGAERTFAEIAACWPQAPIYTLLYDRRAVGDGFCRHEVHTSYLQRLGARQGWFRGLLPLFPRAVEHLPVADFDLVVSSSSAFAHGVRTGSGALHICYCHSPFRYAWFNRDTAPSELPRPLRPLVRGTLNRIRRWDREAATRVTRYVANSKLTQERIREIYGRESEVVYPPVEVDRFAIGTPEDFALVVGQVVSHKRVGVAIEAARNAEMPIKVVGEGPDLAALRKRFDGGEVEFLGSVSDKLLAELYARCATLVVPNAEEFGIAAVEAQAAGRPVVALARGGALETVVDGETGILVEGGDAAAFSAALREVDFHRFDPLAIRAHAERFGSSSFRDHLKALVGRYAAEHDPTN